MFNWTIQVMCYHQVCYFFLLLVLLSNDFVHHESHPFQDDFYKSIVRTGSFIEPVDNSPLFHFEDFFSFFFFFDFPLFLITSILVSMCFRKKRVRRHTLCANDAERDTNVRDIVIIWHFHVLLNM